MKQFLISLLVLIALSWLPQIVLAAGNEQEAEPKLQLQNDNTSSQSSSPVTLEDDILDIRGPVPLPEKTNFPLIIAISLLALLLVVTLFYFLRKRFKRTPPPPTPGEIALMELQEARDLKEKGQALQYIERLSNIIRRYIEAQFHIGFTRQTTSEFLHSMATETGGSKKLLQPHRQMLQQCMEQCDMAKYAHNTPGDEGLEKMENSFHRFISTTSSPENRQGEE